MKYTIITILLIITNINLYSQTDSLSRKEKMSNLNERLKENKSKSIGYFITIKGEKVEIYRLKNAIEALIEIGSATDYGLTAERLFYHDEKGKVIKVKQKKISELFVGNNYYTRLKIGSAFGFNRLHQVIAQNKNYILTEYFSHSSFYYYLFDKNNQVFVYKKQRSSNNTKDDKKFTEKYLKPYFKNCPELISKLDENLSKEYKKSLGQSSYISNLMLGISNFECQ
ncbi:hypothetical protein [Ulvibacter antarcticus]|uniref:Uncharacterized protein n=1 Tax=Ulvibacter antarcticus TaxID=442714 RepID=A0A3L9Z471_9FLAO|nr:hypothetical protein [Ulvibacter antarcticus]RMA67691.1 hypothetical protein BXY75_0001 [Ulvibacter antarcticus]